MLFQYKGINIYYNYLFKDSINTVVYLHGWGRTSSDFNIDGKFNLLLIDLPGFGKSSYVDKSLKLIDYVYCIKELIENLDIENPILIGHSFGGRVSILYAYNYNVRKLILVNSAGIRPKRNIKYYFKIYSYKIKKRIYQLLIKLSDEFIDDYNALKKVGSSDYINLSDEMKQTYSNVVNMDLKKYMKSINCDTYILGGINDNIVPYKKTEEMHNLIKESKLYPFINSGHFLFFDEKEKYQNLINKIVGDKDEINN